MQDGILYTWDVVAYFSHGLSIAFRCARKETAEYLRDWCEAEDENNYRNYASYCESNGFRVKPSMTSCHVDKYFVAESEVIL